LFYKIQPLTRAFNKKTEEKSNINENISDALSLCENLNKFYETLYRLDCAIKKKIAETTSTIRSV